MSFLMDGSGNPLLCDFEHLEVWAERGFVRVLDKRTGNTKLLSPATALRRLKAIQDMLKYERQSLHSSRTLHHEKYDAIIRFLVRVHAILQRALEQGHPDDPTAVRDAVIRRTKVFPAS